MQLLKYFKLCLDQQHAMTIGCKLFSISINLFYLCSVGLSIYRDIKYFQSHPSLFQKYLFRLCLEQLLRTSTHLSSNPICSLLFFIVYCHSIFLFFHFILKKVGLVERLNNKTLDWSAGISVVFRFNIGNSLADLNFILKLHVPFYFCSYSDVPLFKNQGCLNEKSKVR